MIHDFIMWFYQVFLYEIVLLVMEIANVRSMIKLLELSIHLSSTLGGFMITNQVSNYF